MDSFLHAVDVVVLSVNQVLLKDTYIVKQDILGIFFLFFSVLAIAQTPDANIQFKQSPKPAGCFFIAPYKINAKSSKEALLNKAMILNSKGEIIYFRNIPVGNDFKVQCNGVITVWNATKWLLLNNELKITDSVACVNGVETDNHDFMILPNGHYLLIGKTVEITDLSSKPYFNQLHPVVGSKFAKVKYDVIQELDKNKKLVYQWNSKDYFKLEDADRFYLKDSALIDVTHFNSVDEDSDGNLLISARFYNEILKVNKKTGKIIWRMGGKYNDIKLLNDSLLFLGQHDARFTGKSTFSLFDNGHSYDSLARNARALEYEVNDSLKTAKLVWSYSNSEKIFSQAAGSVQRIRNNFTLINYGKISNDSKNIAFELLDRSDKKLVTVLYPDTMASYRAFYYDNCPIKIRRPNLMKCNPDYITTDKPYKYYQWNTGETSAKIKVVKGKVYYVFVSNDGRAYTRTENLKDQ